MSMVIFDDGDTVYVSYECIQIQEDRERAQKRKVCPENNPNRPEECRRGCCERAQGKRMPSVVDSDNMERPTEILKPRRGRSIRVPNLTTESEDSQDTTIPENWGRARERRVAPGKVE